METNQRVYSDLDLDFTKHPITKDVSRKTKDYAVINAVKNLLNTNFNERPFHPEIGSGVRALLFEPCDAVTASLIQKHIEMTIQNFEPRVKLDGIQVNPDPDQNQYSVAVRFYILNNLKPITVTLYLQRLR